MSILEMYVGGVIYAVGTAIALVTGFLLCCLGTWGNDKLKKGK